MAMHNFFRALAGPSYGHSGGFDNWRRNYDKKNIQKWGKGVCWSFMEGECDWLEARAINGTAVMCNGAHPKVTIYRAEEGGTKVTMEFKIMAWIERLISWGFKPDVLQFNSKTHSFQHRTMEPDQVLAKIESARDVFVYGKDFMVSYRAYTTSSGAPPRSVTKAESKKTSKEPMKMETKAATRTHEKALDLNEVCELCGDKAVKLINDTSSIVDGACMDCRVDLDDAIDGPGNNTYPCLGCDRQMESIYEYCAECSKQFDEY